MTKRLLMLALRVAIVLVVVLVAAGGYELKENRRGPFPAPGELSRLDGRDLLRGILDAYDARAWPVRDSVAFTVESRSIVRPVRRFQVTLDPGSRSAEFRAADDPGTAYWLDGGTETISPQDGLLSKELEQYAPSIIWWSMVPRNFADPDADVWKVPDTKIDGRIVRRLAVRWPGEVEWYLLYVDPDSTIRSIDFIDGRFSTFVRWNAAPGTRTSIDGVILSSYWKFSAAHRLLRFLTGYRDLIVLTYRPVR